MFALRRASDIFNAEQPGQICLISQQFPVLIFCPIVFRVCRLFHRQQFGILRPESFQGRKLLLVGTGGFAGSVRGKQFVKCPLGCFAELDRILVFLVVRFGIAGRPITSMLLGATGSGKTYLACALGMAAVRKFLSVKYIRLPELLTELAIARSNGTYRKVVQQYKKPVLLILDEWLLYPLKETEARDLLEIAEARYKKASTIFCSQFDVPGWRDKIGDPILADAICDRIVHDSYPLVIDCKESMRKRKGVSEI